MKNEYRIIRLTVILLALIVISAAIFSGCSAGMSKEQRLATYQNDIMANRNPRLNFQGHSLASTFDFNTLLGTSMNNSLDDLEFRATSILSGDTFEIVYYTVASGELTATGSFHNAGTGGLGGDDWYIYDIVIEGVFFPGP